MECVSRMNLMEILLVTIGISLDVFAAVTCEGAQLAKIHKGKALQACGAAALLQSVALFLGHLGAALLNHFDKQDNLSLTARMAAAIIFLIMGARQLLKAWRRDTVVEHREEVHAVFGKSLHLFQFAAVYTMLAGAGLGLLESSLLHELLILACITVIVVICGLYTGYNYGYEKKTIAYAAGGILLLAGGVDVIVRSLAV